MTKIEPEKVGQKDYYTTHLKRVLMTRQDFIVDFKSAVHTGNPFAAGRMGISEQFCMYYPVMLAEKPNQTQIRVFENLLYYHCAQQGIFPAQPDFLLEYADFYSAHVRNMDYLGLILDTVLGPKILDFHQLPNKLIYFKDQIYDKSSPTDPGNCYLDALKGKKLLIICPFARLLKERATEQIFEGVWQKTGKRWFHPGAVEAMEIPYGFARETHIRFGTSIRELEAVREELDHRDFDVALIGAGGLSIPIDSFVKQMGKISLSLGGDLQVLFGVIGKRWRYKQRWKRDYFNDWWIDMPVHYQPKEPIFRGEDYW